ncbi:RMD1 family protein [Sphingobium sp. H33]|uniref:RMD1 family protein n=2 Tax=Sphingobium nicotianae TaxID=2782607 RepID=A0A9X1IS27_9SPHN|nr:RMD1 family protein [Sphingobium nicotianae]
MSPPISTILSPMSRLAGTPEVVIAGTLETEGALVATAWLVGGSVRTGPLVEDADFIRVAGVGGMVFVFRYGVVVSVQASAQSTQRFDAALAPYIADVADFREAETANLVIRTGSEDRVGPDGQIVLADDSPERLLLVATVLSRSVILARDETLVSEAFERTAPVVSELRQNGRAPLPIRQVMKLVGNVLAARHRVMGMVQVIERPDLLWDHPGLDRLYTRLEAEYELKDRAEILELKFGALGDFADVLLNIVQDKRAFRTEAAIIALIAFELLLNLFEMAIR